MFKKLLIICLKKFLVDLMVDVLDDCLQDLVKDSSTTIDDRVAQRITANLPDIKKAIKGAL